MRKLAIMVACVLCAGVSYSSGAPAADNCTLKQLASFDITMMPGGRILIPVTVAGAEQIFAFELGDPYSAIRTGYYNELFPRKPGQKFPAYYYADDDKTVLPDLHIGTASVKAPKVQIWYWTDEAKFAGVIGVDVLSLMDVELDLAHNKIKLFSQDHCPGQVVYWARDYVTLPIATDLTGTISVPMTLDGKQTRVGFDMKAPHARMSVSSMIALFNVVPGSSELTTLDSERGIYRYPFKSLSADGIAISNPVIDIEQVYLDGICNSKMRYYSLDQLRLCFRWKGLDLSKTEMRALHLYFAFKEKMLYVTAADAHN